MSDRIQWREKDEQDKEFVHTLLRENMLEYFERHLQGWDEDSFQQRWLEIPGKIIVVDGQRVGFYYLRKHENTAHIHEFHIQRTYQNQGIGSHVLATILQQLQQSGIEQIQLHVFKDNPAISFYQRHGFLTVGEGHLGTNWLMMKRL